MNRFADSWKNEHGITLVELLGSIVIISILTASMYGVFTTGFQTYQNINIEAKLRDEADYVMSMLMNKLYSSNYDDVIYNKTTEKLELYKRKDGMLFQNDDVTFQYSYAASPAAWLYIENGRIFFEEANGKKHSFSENDDITLETDSKIDMLCTKRVNIFPRIDEKPKPLTVCQNGILQLHLVFKAKNPNIAPLTVTSEIGF
ncbi:MAG: PilW family protein [Ectobacillus sp.]